MDDFVTHIELNTIKQNIEKEIDKLKNEIDKLKENKVDSLEWQKTIFDITNTIDILNQKIDNLASDRKEDKELMKEMKESMERKIEQLADIITKSSISNATIEANQENTFEKIDNLQSDMSHLSSSLSDLKKSIDNSFWNTFMRLFSRYKIIKMLTWFVIAILAFTMLSAFAFYMSNGIPWDKIKNIYNYIK